MLRVEEHIDFGRQTQGCSWLLAAGCWLSGRLISPLTVIRMTVNRA
jgi:hypothetical protein